MRLCVDVDVDVDVCVRGSVYCILCLYNVSFRKRLSLIYRYYL